MVQMLHIDRQHLKDTQMVYTTGEVLTMDSIHNETFSLYVVPQEFYQFCERYEMNPCLDWLCENSRPGGHRKALGETADQKQFF